MIAHQFLIIAKKCNDLIFYVQLQHNGAKIAILASAMLYWKNIARVRMHYCKIYLLVGRFRTVSYILCHTLIFSNVCLLIIYLFGLTINFKNN